VTLRLSSSLSVEANLDNIKTVELSCLKQLIFTNFVDTKIKLVYL